LLRRELDLPLLLHSFRLLIAPRSTRIFV